MVTDCFFYVLKLNYRILKCRYNYLFNYHPKNIKINISIEIIEPFRSKEKTSFNKG